MKRAVRAKNKSTSVVKSALTTMVKYISVIAIIVAIGVVALIYLGPEITFRPAIYIKLAVASVVLGISVIILYELWLKNGRIEASGEEEYKKQLRVYDQKSDGLYYPTLQEFLDYEHDRRYKVEQDRLTRLLEREQSVLEKLKESDCRKIRLWWSRRRIRKLTSAINTIRIKLPYEKSEEFDYLRYSIQDIVRKEYSPKDTRRHLAKRRTRKYLFVGTGMLIGFNILSIGATMTEDLWQAAIMIVLSIIVLLYAVIDGYVTGYTNISIISLGVYNTAISFIDQAVAYCQKHNKDLYYKGTTEFRDEIPDITIEEPVIPSVDYFTEVSQRVTRND